jgi:hypothetical protein
MAERDPEQLLATYRSGLGPSRAAEDRMLASLQSQIVLPDPSSGVGATSGGAASGGVVSAAGAKLAAVVLVASVGVATVAVAVFGRDPASFARTPTSAPTRAPVVQVDPEPRRVEPPAPTPDRVPAISSAPVVESPPMAIDVPSTPEAARPRSSPRPRARTSEVEPAALADEAKLLRNVDAALRVNDLAVARAQLDAYRRTFASGSLRAQADELALLLGCADQLADATTHALAHLQAHPDTRARKRIEDACGLR